MATKTAIIIGAGPAGLTAAYELLHRTNIKPIIFEKTGDTGGISKTVNYKGNRIDIGGHRFFSKSDRVMQWWLNILALEKTEKNTLTLNYQNKATELEAKNYGSVSADPDKVMLVRKRVSRIYYMKKFFSYPVTLSRDTIKKLGLLKMSGIFFSYLRTKLLPRRTENSLEDFFINRFGKNLYNTFFKDYTEKVWGVACNQIPASWGEQRIKELSVSKAVLHALKSKFRGYRKNDIAQKNTATSLIQQFLYPKWGPGQLWEEVAAIIKAKGGEIYYNADVISLHTNEHEVTAVTIQEGISDTITKKINGDYFFSTMPVKELVEKLVTTVPDEVKNIAAGLQYRDFITVGLLVKKLAVKNGTPQQLIQDNWIYIQDKSVQLGRLQIFNNWSPFMVNNPDTVWMGLEYFCNKEDSFWAKTDASIIQLAINELVLIGLITIEDVLDHTIIRMEKTYPAYFGTYNRFEVVQRYVDNFENLFLVGRNGMHKYNNTDHSMLTAMVAVDNIIAGRTTKENIWSINTEQEYQG